MNRPTGVTVIAVLYFVGAAFFVCIGLAFIVGGAAFASVLADRTGVSAAVFAGAGIFLSIFLFIFAAFHALVGWGLLGLKEWARIVAIVLAAFGALGGAFALFHFSPMGIIRLAISGWMIWYLVQPRVVAAFRGVTAPPPLPVR
jgi:hypothetical protein